MNETLLDKAFTNLETAEIIYQFRNGDEAKLNMVGYHLQQAVELCCKHYLEMNGVRYEKSHDITELLDRCERETRKLPEQSDYIYEHSEMFTMWESKTRYIKNYILSDKKVERALEEVKKFLEASRMKERAYDLAENETSKSGRIRTNEKKL